MGDYYLDLNYTVGGQQKEDIYSEADEAPALPPPPPRRGQSHAKPAVHQTKSAEPTRGRRAPVPLPQEQTQEDYEDPDVTLKMQNFHIGPLPNPPSKVPQLPFSSRARQEPTVPQQRSHTQSSRPPARPIPPPPQEEIEQAVYEETDNVIDDNLPVAMTTTLTPGPCKPPRVPNIPAPPVPTTRTTTNYEQLTDNQPVYEEPVENKDTNSAELSKYQDDKGIYEEAPPDHHDNSLSPPPPPLPLPTRHTSKPQTTVLPIQEDYIDMAAEPVAPNNHHHLPSRNQHLPDPIPARVQPKQSSFKESYRGGSSSTPKMPVKQTVVDPLEVHYWYFGCMTRHEAIAKLEKYKENGMFLVRKSDKDASKPYTLALYYRERVFNLQITKTHEGYVLATANKHTYKTLEEMVEFFSKNYLVLENGKGEIQLQRPLPK